MRHFCEVCSRDSYFYHLARSAISFSVGEVPSAASALPCMVRRDYGAPYRDLGRGGAVGDGPKVARPLASALPNQRGAPRRDKDHRPH